VRGHDTSESGLSRRDYPAFAGIGRDFWRFSWTFMEGAPEIWRRGERASVSRVDCFLDKVVTGPAGVTVAGEDNGRETSQGPLNGGKAAILVKHFLSVCDSAQVSGRLEVGLGGSQFSGGSHFAKDGDFTGACATSGRKMHNMHGRGSGTESTVADGCRSNE
jgi:hypothetical protein